MPSPFVSTALSRHLQQISLVVFTGVMLKRAASLMGHCSSTPSYGETFLLFTQSRTIPDQTAAYATDMAVARELVQLTLGSIANAISRNKSVPDGPAESLGPKSGHFLFSNR